MKGDINLKLSKKSALLLVGVVSAFAAADFVSFVDAKNSGGIIVDGLTEEQVKKIVLDTMPIGSVTIRIDAVNPNTIYGGSWQLISGDASLRLGNGSALTGAVKGNSNNPSVPLVAHSHTYQKTTGWEVVVSNTGWGAVTVPDSGWSALVGTGNSSGTRVAGRIQNSAATSNSAGSPSPTMDVRGQYVEVNVWKRIG